MFAETVPFFKSVWIVAVSNHRTRNITEGKLEEQISGYTTGAEM
jgi:hypothetical protein